jgi:uncharacterized LabA/DUF88 family protein
LTPVGGIFRHEAKEANPMRSRHCAAECQLKASGGGFDRWSSCIRSIWVKTAVLTVRRRRGTNAKRRNETRAVHANAHTTAKALGFHIDYKRLLTEFQSRGTLVRAFHYTAIFEDQKYSSIRPLIDWLDYNGFTVVTKPAKEFDEGDGRRKFKRGMRVELAVDALEIANQVDNIVLFTGDGDFSSLLEAVQHRGVHVTVISSLRSKPPMIADELRRQADTFIELEDLKAAIGRTLEAVEHLNVSRPR